MNTMDVGQMVMRFFEAMEEHAEAHGGELEFEDVVVITAYRLDQGDGDDQIGTAWRSSSDRKHVNLGLLSAAEDLILNPKEDAE